MDRFVGDQIDMSIEHFPPRFELLEIKMNLCRHGFAKGQGPKTELLAIKMNFSRHATELIRLIELIELCTFAIKARMVAVEMNCWPPRIELSPLLRI